MMRYTFQVVIAVVGFLTVAVASVGDAYAAAAAGKNAVPRVVDANNKLVGEVIGTDAGANNPNVILNISAPSIIVQVTRDSIRQYNGLLFSGANCSGQPYLNAPAVPPLFPVVAVINNIVYGQRASTAPGTVTILSYSYYAPEGLVCEPLGVTSNVFIADPIVDLSTQFTPPYRFVYP